MERRNHILRICLTSAIGLMVIYKTYQFKYSNFIFDGMIYGLLVLIGLIVWANILEKDLKYFKKNNQRKYLISGIVGGISLILVCGMFWKINQTFGKSTLLSMYYDGDFNGTGIDFKEDGTYIFDNFCLGSEYSYGRYQINGDEITLDRNEIDNVIKSNRLKIMSKKINYGNETREEYFVYQIDSNGNKLDDKTEFRITVDNRNK